MVSRGRYNFALMTNKSGGLVTHGMSLIPDSATDLAFKTTTTSGDLRIFASVADEDIANNVVGLVQLYGSIVESLLTSATVTRGHYIKQGTVAGKVIDTTVMSDASTAPPTGSIGIALTGVVGAGSIAAFIFPANPAPSAAVPTQGDFDGAVLDFNTVADGYRLKRVGTTIVGEQAPDNGDFNGTILTFDGVVDGEYLKRVGTTIVSGTPAGGGGGSGQAAFADGLVSYMPDLPPMVANAANDEFDDDTLGAGWTAFGTPTTSETEKHGFLKIAKTGTATDAGVYEAFVPGAAAFTVATKMYGDVSEAGSNQVLMAVRDSSGVSIVNMGMLNGSQWIVGAAALGGGFAVGNYTYVTPNLGGPLYVAITRDATTNYICYISGDGIVWRAIATFSQAGTVGRIYLYNAEFSASTTTSYFDFVRAFTSQTTAIGRNPTQPWQPDNEPNIANAMDDEFNDKTGMSGPVNGLAAKWTWRNQSTATLTFPQAAYSKLALPAAASDNFRGLEQTKPAAVDYTVEMKCTPVANATATAMGGLWFVDSVNGDLYFFGLGTTGSGWTIFGGKYTNVTTFSATQGTAVIVPKGFPVYLRSAYINGTTTFTWDYSFDGIAWFPFTSFTDTVVHTRVGFCADESNNSGLTQLFVHWFRRTA